MRRRHQELSRIELRFAPLLIITSVVGLLGCREPAADCWDLLDLQICDGAPAERPVPEGPAPARGWRCSGVRASRRCSDRAEASGPWRCDGATCEERLPRLPDDGAWECADLDGVVVCHGGVPPAGVVAGPADPGWSCGQRRGVASPPGTDRVCIDLSPDLPDGAARGWRCNFTHERGERRVCRRDAKAPAIGAPCKVASACKSDDRCTAGRCVPPRPSPSCWIDPDCGGGEKCRRGSCG